MLEFPKWQDASHWGYPSNMGMEQGFLANGVDYVILPATHRYGGKTRFWVDHARALLGTQKFDQVWIEIVHSHIDDATLEYLASLAPIRLGWSFESLELLSVERENNPEACRIRQETLDKRLPLLTHLLTTDELDAVRLNAEGRSFQSRPIPPGFTIPQEFICDEPAPPSINRGLFFGALYGERKKWLELPELVNVLQYCAESPEMQTGLPRSFDALHEQALQLLQSDLVHSSALDLYLHGNRLIRKEAFKLWLEGLRYGAAVVNLPQWGRAYAGRVIEGMAAGRPVITREMPDRPLAKAAFEDGKEILLYRTPSELAAHLERIIADPQYARTIAQNATKRIRATHTSETYFAELLRWLGS